MVEGGESLSFDSVEDVANGKPRTDPMAGLEIGIGAITKDPRFGFFGLALSLSSLSVVVGTGSWLCCGSIGPEARAPGPISSFTGEETVV